MILALDLGTGSLKGALYSESGERLSLASVEYGVARPAPSFAEQDPRDYLEAAAAVIRKLNPGRVEAVGLSTQTPTLVFCDDAGHPSAPAILWQDARAAEEARTGFRAEWFGLDLDIGAAATPPKLLWMKRRAPEAWRATRWVMQPKDFLVFHLTGALTTDPWCAKGIAHLASGEVHPDYLALLGKEISPCPPVRAPNSIAGQVTPAAAARFGLTAGTPVSVGWSDALAGILATGALGQKRRGFVLTGTSEIVGLSLRPRERAKGLYRVPAAVLDLHGLELHYGPTQAGGACLAWVARLLGKTPAEALALVDSPAPTPILFRPYLYGERAPYWDHELRAGFEGLRAEHGAADVVRAVLQGVALQERLILECAERGEPAHTVFVAGGASRDGNWNQLRAAILQRPLVVLRDPEASLRGAAMLALGAIRPYFLANLSEDWFAGEEIAPDAAQAGFSRELAARFRQLRK